MTDLLRQNKTPEKLMMVDEKQLHWDEQLPYVLMANRSSVQKSTQTTPNLMCFGREISLHMDVATPPTPDEKVLSGPEILVETQKKFRCP